MIQSDVNEIVNYTLTIFLYLTDADELSQLNFVINSGIVPHILPFLKSAEEETQVLALKVFNNLSYGSDSQTRVNKYFYFYSVCYFYIINK